MKSQSGFTLIEVLVFMVLLVSVSTASYSFVSSGKKLGDTTEYRVQAINIAREGLEIVRTYRDTNWLAFSGDKENCWMVDRTSGIPPDTCIGGGAAAAPLLTDGYYTADVSVSPWRLYKISGYDPNASIVEKRKYTQIGLKATTRVPFQSTGSLVMTDLPPCGQVPIDQDCQTRFARILHIEKVDSMKYSIASITSWVEGDGIARELRLDLALSNWREAGNKQSCILSDGTILAEGVSRDFYTAPSAMNCNLIKTTRTCLNGFLTGDSSAKFPSCSTSPPLDCGSIGVGTAIIGSCSISP